MAKNTPELLELHVHLLHLSFLQLTTFIRKCKCKQDAWLPPANFLLASFEKTFQKSNTFRFSSANLAPPEFHFFFKKKRIFDTKTGFRKCFEFYSNSTASLPFFNKGVFSKKPYFSFFSRMLLFQSDSLWNLLLFGWQERQEVHDYRF